MPRHRARLKRTTAGPSFCALLQAASSSKAPQLQDILIYICQRALTDSAAIIKEYEIGCNALGRKPDFNPNEDNIVRVQISHLRRKMDEYFATDGKDEPLLITVPKGAYVPRFEQRPEAVVAPDSLRLRSNLRRRPQSPASAHRLDPLFFPSPLSAGDCLPVPGVAPAGCTTRQSGRCPGICPP